MRPLSTPHPRPHPRRRPAAALCLLAALFITPLAPAHPADELVPRIEVRVDIQGTRVEYSAYIPARIYHETILGIATIAEARALSDPIIADRVQKWWADTNPVQIDALTVLPRFVKAVLYVPEVPLPDLSDDQKAEEFGSYSVELLYTTLARPRRIDLAWGHYLPAMVGGPPAPNSSPSAGTPPPTDPVVGVILTAWDRVAKLITFTRAEPGYTWHGDLSGPPPDMSVPAVRQPLTLFLPLVSLAFLASALLFWPLMARTGFSRKSRFLMALAAAAGAIAFSTRAGIDVELPFEKRLTRPDNQTAVLIFESLMRNVYRAFDHDSELAIYDTLAQSVAGPELERVYREVYETLIMREEGGALSRVEDVTFIDSAVIDNAALDVTSAASSAANPAESIVDSQRYTVRSTWRVKGMVLHWGHVHRRENEYTVTAAVAPSGGAWKIIARNVEAQRRLLDSTEPAAADASAPATLTAPAPDPQSSANP